MLAQYLFGSVRHIKISFQPHGLPNTRANVKPAAAICSSVASEVEKFPPCGGCGYGVGVHTFQSKLNASALACRKGVVPDGQPVLDIEAKPVAFRHTSGFWSPYGR